MKKVALTIAMCLALGTMVAPAAATMDTDDGTTTAWDSEQSCTRDVPPSYCKIGPVVCSFQGDVGCSVDAVATASEDPLCTLDVPPTACSVGPVTCSFQDGVSCSVDA